MAASETFRNLAPHKQERILQEALKEFAAKGYAKGSINHLVNRLGISKGSIFQYFGDKAGLFTEVFNYASQMIRQGLNHIRQQTWDRDVFERLANVIMMGLALQDNHPRYIEIYLRVVYEKDIPGRDHLLREFHLSFRDFLVELFERGKQAGQIADDIQPELAGLVALAVIERFMVARAVRHKDMGTGIHQADTGELDQLVAQAMTILKRGMGVNRDAPTRQQLEQIIGLKLHDSSDAEDLEFHADQHGYGELVGASRTFHHLPRAKRERIMREAIWVFAESGYGKASINTLVSRLSISKGSIFKYFRHKAGLFFAVFHFVLDKSVGPLRRLLEESRGQDIFTRLYLTALVAFNVYQQKQRYFQLYLRIVHDPDLPMRDWMLKTLTEFSTEYMTTLFSDARAAGDIPEDFNLEMGSLVAIAVLERLLVAHGVAHKDLEIGLYRADRETVERISFQVIDYLRRGLGPQ